MSAALLEVTDIKKYFPVRRGLLLREVASVKAIDGVSLQLNPGETLALVGESGCGKSTLGRLIVRIYDPTAGSVKFNGRELAKLSGKELKQYRREVQMVFQDPYSSLNPRMNIRSILEAPLRVHESLTALETDQRIARVLERVGLDARAKDRYPHEFSGGQRQRIAIARAIIVAPKLIIADEPVSALDVSIRAQILNLLKDIQEEMGMAMLFISHDLAVVKHMAPRIAVMYLGKIVEVGDRADIFKESLHPYTHALLASNPNPRGSKVKHQPIRGDVPSPLNPPSGCPFHPRCPQFALGSNAASCQSQVPELKAIKSTNLSGTARQVSCHLRA